MNPLKLRHSLGFVISENLSEGIIDSQPNNGRCDLGNGFYSYALDGVEIEATPIDVTLYFQHGKLHEIELSHADAGLYGHH